MYNYINYCTFKYFKGRLKISEKSIHSILICYIFNFYKQLFIPLFSNCQNHIVHLYYFGFMIINYP